MLGCCSALVPRAATARATTARRAEEPTSLGGAMFKQLFGGLQNAFAQASDAKDAPAQRSSDVAAGRAAARAEAGAITDLDARAQTGDVTFDDFLKVGRTFKQFNGRVPGMPGTLTEDQISETLAKFAVHEKIVGAMSDEERRDPQLMLDDVANTDENCPRVQRVAAASGCAEKDVALFMAEFEAMRQSTQRIAAGEDPDAVNADIGSSNRAMRRAQKKPKKRKR